MLEMNDIGSLVAGSASPLLGTYRPVGPVFTGGDGSFLISEDGGRYLDFTTGIAVNSLGYGDPDVAAAIRRSLDAGLIHASNLFMTEPATELAGWLVERSFADRVFFCNSGAEATEGALKFARRWAGSQARDRAEIVAFRGGFHGRTMGALSVTDRPAYQQPFQPLLPGVHFAEVGDADGLAALMGTGRIAAVIVEPIQGEGGVRPVAPSFLKTLRELCDVHGALLIFDEVQVGLGRTGTLWAHQQTGVEPDIMTLAKPLGGGLPMGAVLLTEAVAAAVRPGDHATTFGGGPLVASAALAVCRRIGEPDFLASVARKGTWLGERLGGLALRHEAITGVRGAGMFWGIETRGAAAEVVQRALTSKLLLCGAGENVVRIAPPLTISDAELELGIDLLEGAL